MSQSPPAIEDGASGEACPGDCRTCSPAPAETPAADRLAGGRLAGAAMGAFLLPLAAAMAGAILAGSDRQFVGCLIGLIGGAAVAWIVARALRRPPQDR